MALEPLSLDAIRTAHQRIASVTMRTPLVRLDVPSSVSIHLKLENLQPIGSFKIRGAASAMAAADPAALSQGVYTASAGNMAQGVAWCARERGIPCTVIVPERAPDAKVGAVERLGARVVRVPFDEWWQAMMDHGHPGQRGLFIHPFADANVMAGNATIGVEIVEDFPAIDTVLVPWGGGGLACGIASAVRHLCPRVRVLAVEVEGAAPLIASRAAGRPIEITPAISFIDGIGGRGVAPEMWPMATSVIDGVVAVTVAQVADAVRLIAERARVVAEGAGAAALAAALHTDVGGGSVACVVSGGNIDAAKLATILRGEIP